MSRIYGIVLGVVTDVDHPDGEGAIQVDYPWLNGKRMSRWAPVASPMAGAGRGIWFPPEVDDEVVLAFDRGDPERPYIVGYLWNGVDGPPSGAVRERMIRSYNGHTIRFLDSTPTAGGNAGGIAIEDAGGNQIVLTNGKVTIRSTGTLEINAATIVLCNTVNGQTVYSRVVTANNNPI
jgi:uncharacterized protein involved in type VI secretion and phage assembly